MNGWVDVSCRWYTPFHSLFYFLVWVGLGRRKAILVVFVFYIFTYVSMSYRRTDGQTYVYSTVIIQDISFGSSKYHDNQWRCYTRVMRSFNLRLSRWRFMNAHLPFQRLVLWTRMSSLPSPSLLLRLKGNDLLPLPLNIRALSARSLYHAPCPLVPTTSEHT